MTIQIAAFALFALTFVTLMVAGIVAQQRFFAAYAHRFPNNVRSDDEIRDQFFENPLRLAASGPSLVAGRLDLLLTAIQDVELEFLRRRCLIILGAAATWMFVGIPATFLLAALTARLPHPIGGIAGIILVAAWTSNLIWAIRRGRTSGSFVLAAVGGIYVGAVFLVGVLGRNS